MPKTRRLLSMLLAVLMLLSMCTVGMLGASAAALPDGSVVGGEDTAVEGDVIGRIGDTDGNERDVEDIVENELLLF